MASVSGLDRYDSDRARRWLARDRACTDTDQRIERFSALLLGAPYRASPLIGSATTAEVFTISLRHFDCVTYVEAVLALAQAGTVRTFAAAVRKLRYHRGEVDWRARNHYMTEWIARNATEGRLARLTLGAKRHRLERRLDAVPGLAPRRSRFTYLRVDEALRRSDRIPSGTLVLFVSMRASLDVFHCGFLIRRADEIWLRHATRRRRQVVEQPLREFLRANRTLGLILAQAHARGRP